MHAELQVLSPLVPVREVTFLRFCKQHAEGVWAVVDVSVDAIRETPGGAPSFPSCRRLPSGCVVQDMPNGYSKVKKLNSPLKTKPTPSFPHKSPLFCEVSLHVRRSWHSSGLLLVSIKFWGVAFSPKWGSFPSGWIPFKCRLLKRKN